MLRRILLLGLVLGLAGVYACKDDDDDDHDHPKQEFPACEEIAEACHPLDTGSGAPHECHELAHHATEEATCTAKKAECLAACPPGTDGGADAAADATPE